MPADAKLGALMEAMESHAAENFTQIDRVVSWNSLGLGERYGAWSDFARDRQAIPEQTEAIEWTTATDLSGKCRLVPFACVSMDLTTRLGTGLERTTNGLAAGFELGSARMAALMELIERDAVTAWRTSDLVSRMKCTINLADLRFEWLQGWLAKLRAAGSTLQCYAVPSFTGMPVVAAELSDLSKGTKAYRAIEGSAAHPLPHIALLRAVSEVIQGRCAYVAGSRDDMMPKDYESKVGAVQMVFGLPLPPSMVPVALSSIPEGCQSLSDLCGIIEHAGLGPVMFVDVGRVGDIHVVKAFAAGFGNRLKLRRTVQ